MEDLLTTREVQELLKVDRITIYRMLNDGRIKGVKIGQQWRFTRREVERLAGLEAPASEAAQSPTEASFPIHCVQTIQDLFSEISQIGALVIDGEGNPLTQISHPCAFCQALSASPTGLEACRESWQTFARHSASGSKYFTCHAGLQYIGAPLADKGEQAGLFLAGPFYWRAPDPGEEAARVRRLASNHNLLQEALQQAAGVIPVIDPALHARLETWPFTAARAIQSILHERFGFVERLQQIANLTQIS